MNLETYKISIRAYYPDVSFVDTGVAVETVGGKEDWLHTLYWKDGNAYFAISDTVLTEQSLMKYLKKASETNELTDHVGDVPVHIIDKYETRTIKLLNTLCDDYRKGAKR